MEQIAWKYDSSVREEEHEENGLEEGLAEGRFGFFLIIEIVLCDFVTVSVSLWISYFKGCGFYHWKQRQHWEVKSTAKKTEEFQLKKNQQKRKKAFIL